jgi:hypothetical protein
MAYKMRVSLKYGTHLAALIKAVEKTSGDVLELGTGIFSTPYLHYACTLSKRNLVSYENYQEWFDFLKPYENEYHKVNFVEKYADAPIDKEWDVVLIDQTPDSSRSEEIRRLANSAKYIIIHDSNNDKRSRRLYKYYEIYPLFKYKKIWDKDSNHATVLSNFVELENLWE